MRTLGNCTASKPIRSFSADARIVARSAYAFCFVLATMAGELRVTLLSALGLRDTRLLGKMKCFATVKVTNGREYRTKVSDGSPARQAACCLLSLPSQAE